MEEERKNEPATFEAFERTLERLYAEYTFAFAERESGVPAAVIEEVAGIVASAGTRLSTHTWRSAAAGNLGGWQVSRTLFLLNALLGAVGVPGGTFPNAWNKFVPKPIYSPPAPAPVERAHLAAGVPAGHERDVVPPAAPPQGRPREARGLLQPRLQPGLDQPRRLLVDRGDHRRVEDRPARGPDPDLERVGRLRGLRPPGGSRLRASRHPLLRDPRRAVARLPPARAPRGEGAAGPAGHRHARGEPGRGVGGERALDRALVAHRPGRGDGHPPVLRVEEGAGEEADRGRVLRVHLRELAPGPAGEGEGRGPHAPRVHAPLRCFRDQPQGGRAARVGRSRGGAPGRPRVPAGPRVHPRGEAAFAERGAGPVPGPGLRGPSARRGRAGRERSGAASRPRAAGSSSTPRR